MKKSSNSLKAIRKRAGYTLKALSEATGVPISTINNFENGNRSLSDDAMRKVCAILRVKSEEILQPDQAAAMVRESRAPPYGSVSEQIIALAETIGIQEGKIRDAIAEILKRGKEDEP